MSPTADGGRRADRPAPRAAARCPPTPTSRSWRTARCCSRRSATTRWWSSPARPGSGKSTQLPKLCLELGLGVRGLIGHTQPRRLAARAVSERIAEELGTEIGDAVGFTVRFNDRVGEDTFIKVMTDGILLAEIQRDRHLRAYEVLIIDEAHERSLNIDFLLGYLRQLLPRATRPEGDRHLGDHRHRALRRALRRRARWWRCPDARTRWRSATGPIGEDEGDDRDQTQAIVDAVQELTREGPGDLLVFLSGERDIRDTADALARLDLPGRRAPAALRPAVGGRAAPRVRAAPRPPDRAGHQRGGDVAHRARDRRRDRPRHGAHLPLQPAHQGAAAARSRRSRRRRPPSEPAGAGASRRAPASASTPRRTSTPARSSPSRRSCAPTWRRSSSRWPRSGSATSRRSRSSRRPTPGAIKDGILLLEELGALERGRAAADDVRLTKLGRRLARIPVDPRLARMVVEADRHGVVGEVLVLAAALSIQDPRERPTGEEEAAAAHHRRFADPDSDFVAYLNLWRYLREQQKALGSSAFRRMCRSEHLHHLRIREWQDVHSQLRQVALGIGLKVTPLADEARRRRRSTARCSRGSCRRSGCSTRTATSTAAPARRGSCWRPAPGSGAGARSG